MYSVDLLDHLPPRIYMGYPFVAICNLDKAHLRGTVDYETLSHDSWTL